MAISRISGMGLWDLPDCMGLSEGGKCIWLITDSCTGEGCAFKCSKIQYKISYINSLKRLASLNYVKQAHIANKYFSGRMPWT